MIATSQQEAMELVEEGIPQGQVFVRCNGIEVPHPLPEPGRFRRQWGIAPETKLIIQAVGADENRTVELYRRGVRGIISRSISPDLLVRCVRRIAAGETWIDNQSVNWVIEAYRAQAAALVSPRTQPRLSPKEMAIITCITQGKRNKEIAFQLGTTEQVIKNYLRKIYDKLGVSDRLELALYCLHNKIIQSDADEVEVAQRVARR